MNMGTYQIVFTDGTTAPLPGTYASVDSALNAAQFTYGADVERVERVYSTAAQTIDPLWILFGLGLLVLFSGRRRKII